MSDINFPNLVNLIKLKIDLEGMPNISLSFQLSKLKYVIEMVDESDVKHLKKVIHKVYTIVHVHMVDRDLVKEAQKVQYNVL